MQVLTCITFCRMCVKQATLRVFMQKNVSGREIAIQNCRAGRKNKLRFKK